MNQLRLPKYASTTERQLYRDKRIRNAILGLLSCIPDEGVLNVNLTSKQVERRIRAAQRVLKEDL